MQFVVPFEFQEVRLPKHGLIVVQSSSGTWGVYDTKGVLKLPLVYDLPPNILNLETIIVCKMGCMVWSMIVTSLGIIAAINI